MQFADYNDSNNLRLVCLKPKNQAHYLLYSYLHAMYISSDLYRLSLPDQKWNFYLIKV